MRIGFHVINLEENYLVKEKHRLLSIKKEINQILPEIDTDILSLNKLQLDGYINIGNWFHFCLTNKIIRKLFINRLSPQLIVFFYKLILFLNYKKVMKHYFEKNKYDYVFIWSDASFNEELVISQYVKTLCIQFTMNTSNTNELVRWFKYEREKHQKKAWLIEKLTQASQYRCFGELYGPHGGNYINHLVMKLLNILPEGERMGMGESSAVFVMGDKFKDEFIKLGVPKEKIHIGGALSYSKIFDLKPNFMIEEKKIVTIFLQNIKKNDDLLFGNYDFYNSLSILLNQVKNTLNNNVIFYFKLHPKELHSPFLEEFFQSFSVAYKVFKQGSVSNYDLIYSSDLNITMCSTVGIDTMLLKKPLLSFNFGILLPDFLKYICKDIFVDSPENSATYIEKIFKNHEFKNTIIEKAYSDVQHFVNIQSNVVKKMLMVLKNNA